MALTYSPTDVTSRVLDRVARKGDLHGTSDALAFLEEHLALRNTLSEELFPGQRVALLYGREGSGKTMLVNRFAASDLDHAMGHTCDFNLHEWNMREFKDWIELRLRDLDELHRSATDVSAKVKSYRRVDRVTFIIGNLHRFNYMRGHDDVFVKLLHLLHRVRLFQPSDKVRVLLICNENPGQFPSDLLKLIDKSHLMAPPDPEARREIMLDLMGDFKVLKESRVKELELLGWDINLDPAVIDEDPTHIIHTLVVASAGCTPREITAFMTRSFSGCLKPKENGDTVYNSAWIEALLYKLEGSIPCITPSNPASLNESCFKYAGLGVSDFTQQLGTNNKSCFVRDVPLVLNPNAGDNAAEPLNEEGKRPRLDLQPPTVTEALQARLNQQGESLASAARQAKRVKGRNQDRE
jgi:hypothetical protein